MRSRRQLQQSHFINHPTYLGRIQPRPYQNGRSYGACNYCSNYHRNQADKCYFLCHYCHSLHFKTKSAEHQQTVTICPLLQHIALQQQNKKAYPCDQCGGYGIVEKHIKTTYLQPKQLFQKRIGQYQNSKQANREPSLFAPERRIFKKVEQTKQQQCQRCNGKGKHYRMVACCQTGCNQCGFSTLTLNLKWRQIRSKGQPSDQTFPCRICAQEVSVGQKVFKLHCGHTFHLNCIFSWLYRRQGCYTCTEVDPYLQRKDIPFESLTKLSHVESIPKKPGQLAMRLQEYIQEQINKRKAFQDSFLSSQFSEQEIEQSVIYPNIDISMDKQVQEALKVMQINMDKQEQALKKEAQWALEHQDEMQIPRNQQEQMILDQSLNKEQNSFENAVTNAREESTLTLRTYQAQRNPQPNLLHLMLQQICRGKSQP